MPSTSKVSVPFGAGMSRDESRVYFDKHIPAKLHMRNGRVIDVHKAIAVHETVENKAMDTGLSYEKAHEEIAVPAENAEVRRQGGDPKEYNEKLGPKLRQSENESDEDLKDLPADLDPRPYIDEALDKQAFLAGYLCKQAELDSSMLVPAYAVTYGAPIAANYAAYKMLRNSLENTPDVSQEQIATLGENSDVSGIPLVPKSGLRNAMYVPPHGIEDTDIAHLPVQKKNRARKLGMIAYDPNFRKAGIIGHELGHAEIANEPGFSLSKINQEYLRPLGQVGSLAGTVASFAIRDPALALGVAGGSQLLGHMPTLFNEYQASSKGKALMALQRFKSQTHAANDQTLRRAWNTYLVAAIAPVLALGAGYGLMYHKDLGV